MNFDLQLFRSVKTTGSKPKKSSSKSSGGLDAYCVRCKTKRTISGGKKEKRGNRNFMMGKCGECGTKMSRILAADA